MSKSIKPGELGAALERELTIYSEAVNDKILNATIFHMDELVRITRETAPNGKRHRYGGRITSDTKALRRMGGGGGLRGRTFRATWYVKAPDYRLTHLLVHGHATRNGGRTKADPFLQNALDKVLPEYEESIREAVKHD